MRSNEEIVNILITKRKTLNISFEIKNYYNLNFEEIRTIKNVIKHIPVEQKNYIEYKLLQANSNTINTLFYLISIFAAIFFPIIATTKYTILFSYVLLVLLFIAGYKSYSLDILKKRRLFIKYIFN